MHLLNQQTHLQQAYQYNRKYALQNFHSILGEHG